MTEMNDDRSRDLIVNDLQKQMRRVMSRTFLKQLSTGSGLDDKRNGSWQNYGYKENLEFEDFYRLWRRNGIANALVTRTIGKSWHDDPEIIQGDLDQKDKETTPWETSVKLFADKYDMWHAFQEADLYQMVGGFSGLILQVADGKAWNEPLTKSTRDKRLYKFIPAWKGQLTPISYEDDQKKLTFGMPTMYMFQELAVGETGNKGAARNLEIHPDRVIAFGDYETGLSCFEASFNAFVNLEKITGGSGESFLKNASRQLAINFAKEVDLSAIAAAHKKPIGKIQEIFDQITTNMNLGMDQSILTQGAEVKPLVATVPDPEHHYAIALGEACAPFQCPTKIVIGNQEGSLASTEDKREWAETNQARRVSRMSRFIKAAILHLQQFGFIQKGEFAVKWSNLAEMTDSEKVERALKLAEINAKNFISGDLTYRTEEIRDASGHDNDEAIEKLPEDDSQDDDLPPADNKDAKE